MDFSTIMTLGFVLSLILAAIVCFMVMSEKKAKKLKPFFQLLHNIINFKSLMIEKLTKFFYVVTTINVIIVGFLCWFSSDLGFGLGLLVGLLVMLLGPIVVRIIYEFTMLTILLVYNVIDIRNKLYGEEKKANEPTISFSTTVANAAKKIAKKTAELTEEEEE